MKNQALVFICIILFCPMMELVSQDYWHYLGSPPGGRVETIAINDSGIIISSAYGSGFYRSDDNATSWVNINKGLYDNSVTAVAFSHDGSMYAGTDDLGLFMSPDMGNTWVQNDSLDSGRVSGIAINDSNY